VSVRTFKGGIHPPEFKGQTNGLSIESLPLADELFVPLHQHTGKPCDSLVSIGDRVLKGQKIGDTDGFISAPVHSPVTGTVTSIEKRIGFSGQNTLGVAISVDQEGQEETAFMEAMPDWEQAEVGTIQKAAREAGLVGLGGAAFPTHVKLSPPEDKAIDTVIINGCECEPFLTCDHRLMLEEAEQMITGSRIMKKAVGADKIIIGIEDNKPDAVEHVRQAARDYEDISVQILETKYPQGAEKQLIQALVGREVPSGKLPMDVGALVHNVGTAVALAQAVVEGRPLLDRVITVSGPSISRPANVRVPVGTPISHVIEHLGGLKDDVARVVLGGPMTGTAQSSLSVAVVKGTSGILAMNKEITARLDDSYKDCVRCNRCVSACPMFLYPNFLGVAAEYRDWDRAEQEGALDCVECGVCAFVCPSARPLVRFFRGAKAAIWEKRRQA